MNEILETAKQNMLLKEKNLSKYACKSECGKWIKEDIEDIKDAKKIAIKMPITSKISEELIRKITLRARAISKILIIGSPKDSSKIERKVFFFFLVISFVPNLRRDSSTSLSFNPRFIFPPIKYMQKITTNYLNIKG